MYEGKIVYSVHVSSFLGASLLLPLFHLFTFHFLNVSFLIPGFTSSWYSFCKYARWNNPRLDILSTIRVPIIFHSFLKSGVHNLRYRFGLSVFQIICACSAVLLPCIILIISGTRIDPIIRYVSLHGPAAHLISHEI